MKVSLIQAMPKMETTAIMPAMKTLERAMSGAFTLVAKRMNDPKASMMICTTVVMGTTLPFTRGRRPGFMAMRMMVSTPAKKRPTDSLAVKGIFMPRVVTLASRALANSGSFMRSRNSGSWSSSLPRLKLQAAATSTPMMPAGRVMRMMSKRPTGWPFLAAMARKVVTAAATGLAVIPIWEATLEIAMGRSGRMRVFRATSLMTGSSA